MGVLLYFISIVLAIVAFLSYDIFQMISMGSIFDEIPQSDFSFCHRVPEIKGCEDLVVHQPSGYAFAGCPEDYKLMASYMTLKYMPRTSVVLSKKSSFVSYNIKDKKALKLSIKGFLEGVNFSIHGIDIIEDKNDSNLLHLLAINHRGNATDSVEHFKHRIGSSEIVYVESFLSDCLKLINNIAALSPTTFYYSQDLSHVSGPLFYMENLGLWAGGKVMFYGGKEDCRELASGIKYSNGIALSSDRRLLYVAESFRAKLLVFERDSEDSIPDIELKEQVPLKFLPDNINVDQSTGQIYVAGYSSNIKESLKFVLYDGVSNTDPFKGVVARIVNETGEGRFFGRNYLVEPILVDHGDTLFSTSVAASDEIRGALLLSGLFTSRGMLDCRPPMLKNAS